MATWYYYIGSVAMLLQLFFVLLTYRNHRYALSKYERPRGYRPKTALIIPCKGLDTDFEKNVSSFFRQDYENYLLWFVVQDEQDPAYEKLCSLRDSLSQYSKALEVKVSVAGLGSTCSQKIHNLLYCYQRVPDDVEVLAFADSDITIGPEWLSHLVYPLRQQKVGVASGYRWFVPKENNSATLALSAGNAKVAQLLGNTIFNQAWGGSMAVRVETFRKVEMDKIWPQALSDDLSLSEAVKKEGLKVAFVPACLAASYEATTWPEAFEFVRRQFLITKVYSPGTWLFSITASTGAVLTTWGALAVAVFAAIRNLDNLSFYFAVPFVTFTCQLVRAMTRELTVSKLLARELSRLKYAIAADIFFFWLWSIVLWVLIVSTSFGRTIHWRGIRYKMISPTETLILKD